MNIKTVVLNFIQKKYYFLVLMQLSENLINT